MKTLSFLESTAWRDVEVEKIDSFSGLGAAIGAPMQSGFSVQFNRNSIMQSKYQSNDAGVVNIGDSAGVVAANDNSPMIISPKKMEENDVRYQRRVREVSCERTQSGSG